MMPFLVLLRRYADELAIHHTEGRKKGRQKGGRKVGAAFLGHSLKTCKLEELFNVLTNYNMLQCNDKLERGQI